MRVLIADINNYLVCKLCNGYFRECHTIPECMHSFCKCCLIQYFTVPQIEAQAAKKPITVNHQCPTCKLALGKSPLLKIIYDRNIQAIVDKLFPILKPAGDNNSHDDQPPTKKRKQSNDTASENKLTSDKIDMDKKILLRLLPHPDQSLRGNDIQPLKKSVFNLKKSTKVEKLCPEIAKRLLSIETDKVAMTSDLQITLYVDHMPIDESETIFNALLSNGKTPSLFDKDGVSQDSYEMYYGRSIISN